jgi:hypothetical protein
MTLFNLHQGFARSIVTHAVMIAMLFTSGWIVPSSSAATEFAAEKTSDESGISAAWDDSTCVGGSVFGSGAKDLVKSWTESLKWVRQLLALGSVVLLASFSMVPACREESPPRSLPLCDQACHERSGVLLA